MDSLSNVVRMTASRTATVWIFIVPHEIGVTLARPYRKKNNEMCTSKMAVADTAEWLADAIYRILDFPPLAVMRYTYVGHIVERVEVCVAEAADPCDWDYLWTPEDYHKWVGELCGRCRYLWSQAMCPEVDHIAMRNLMASILLYPVMSYDTINSLVAGSLSLPQQLPFWAVMSTYFVSGGLRSWRVLPTTDPLPQWVLDVQQLGCDTKYFVWDTLLLFGAGAISTWFDYSVWPQMPFSISWARQRNTIPNSQTTTNIDINDATADADAEQCVKKRRCKMRPYPRAMTMHATMHHWNAMKDPMRRVLLREHCWGLREERDMRNESSESDDDDEIDVASVPGDCAAGSSTAPEGDDGYRSVNSKTTTITSVATTSCIAVKEGDALSAEDSMRQSFLSKPFEPEQHSSGDDDAV